jgi:hypothetical protein
MCTRVCVCAANAADVAAAVAAGTADALLARLKLTPAKLTQLAGAPLPRHVTTHTPHSCVLMHSCARFFVRIYPRSGRACDRGPSRADREAAFVA